MIAPENPNVSLSLTVLTGFLGAGKTTLLNRILNGNHGLRTAVLVNDFGSVNIDAELVVSVDEDVISLSNGCVCCSIRDDLNTTIDELLRLEHPPEHVILEASGVADPAGIAITFSTENYARGVKLDSIICVLDAENIFANPEQMPLRMGQIAASDILLLNKIDLVDETQIEKIESWLSQNFYRHRVVKTNKCEVSMEVLLATGNFNPAHEGFESVGRTHGCADQECEHSGEHHTYDTSNFKTWTYETRSAFALGALEQVVGKLPKNIFRCKGILNTVDAPDRKTIMQVVGKRVSFSDGGSWKQNERISKIVVISLNDEPDFEDLKNRLDQCLDCLAL